MPASRFGILVVISMASAVALPAIAQEPSSPLSTFGTLAQTVRWSGLAASLGVVLAAWILLRLVGKAIDDLSQVFAGRRFLLRKVSVFFAFSVYLITVVTIILLSFEISREMLAILGGTVAVAFGFALKDLAASLISGVLLLFDRPFQVGDRVRFRDEYGDVTSIGLRSVKLRTLDDSTVTVPNNLFLTDVTTSGNSGAPDMQTVVDFHIGIDQDVHRARALAREAAVVSPYVYLDKPVEVLVSQVIVDHYFALRLRLKVYVADTRFEKALESDVTLRVLEAFAEHRILPPAMLQRSAATLSPIDHRRLRVAAELA